MVRSRNPRKATRPARVLPIRTLRTAGPPPVQPCPATPAKPRVPAGQGEPREPGLESGMRNLESGILNPPFEGPNPVFDNRLVLNPECAVAFHPSIRNNAPRRLTCVAGLPLRLLYWHW